MSRWIAMHCCEETDELQARHPNAFLLLCQIARRAKWRDCLISKLKAGEAFIGDWREAGLPSEMAYRHAKKVLLDTGLATFRGTNRGTVASLTTRTIFSVSGEPSNEQDTVQQQSSNRPTTTNHTDTRYTDTRTPEKKRPSASPPISEETLPLGLNSPEFANAWADWIRHRKEIRKPLTPTSTRQQLAKLETLGLARAIEAIRHSIANGWQGIFEPKDRLQPAIQAAGHFVPQFPGQRPPKA